jgi:hypothetical protein
MPCHCPLDAWYSKEINPATGKRGIVFSQSKAYQPDDPFLIPCGRCIGCRLEYSRQWAVRCIHESQMHDQSCFITLTFDDDHLHNRGVHPSSVSKRDLQLFFKRLRKKGVQFRYYACGEYGEKTLRPHYHALLFGCDFRQDRYPVGRQGSHILYSSPLLEEAWPYGHVSIGELTFESAAYVARYVLKKQKGDDKDIYTNVCSDTGEIIERNKEFVLMSLKPGIGQTWYDKYGKDVYPNDFVVINNVKMKPPRYYDNLLMASDPFTFDDVSEKREIRGRQREKTTSSRYLNKKLYAEHSVSKLKRTI